MGRKLATLSCLIFVATACGGGGPGSTETTTTPPGATSSTTTVDSPTTTTTSVPATTTTSPTVTTTADPTSSVPPECLEPFQQFLIDMELAASTYDFEGAGLHDWEQFTIAIIPAATEMVTAYGQTMCLDPTTGSPDPAIYAAILDWTQQNAPGSLTWLEVQEEMQEMGLRSGENCSDFLEIHEEYVARGGTVFDLTRAERFHAYSTFGSINQWCDLRTAGDYTFRSDVLAYMVLEG